MLNKLKQLYSDWLIERNVHKLIIPQSPINKEIELILQMCQTSRKFIVNSDSHN